MYDKIMVKFEEQDIRLELLESGKGLFYAIHVWHDPPGGSKVERFCDTYRCYKLGERPALEAAQKKFKQLFDIYMEKEETWKERREREMDEDEA